MHILPFLSLKAGRGYAHGSGSFTDIAFDAVPGLIIAAQILPGENASTAVLKKLGFHFV